MLAQHQNEQASFGSVTAFWSDARSEPGVERGVETVRLDRPSEVLISGVPPSELYETGRAS